MASTYSTNLKIELIGTGEQAGLWGNTTNTNLGTALEQAIVGKADIDMNSTTVTLTLTNTNAAQNARAIYLNLTGTPGGAAVLEVPGVQKPYIVKNGSNQVVTVKVTGQTGVAVPVGKTMWLYNNGTDVVNAIDNLPSGATVGGVAIGTGNGDVVGPASATDNAIVRFDLTTGKLVQDSVVTIADTTGDIAGAGSITSTSASGILTRAAATQDGVEIVGRAGGSNSYKVSLTPATLAASRTITITDGGGNYTLGYLNIPAVADKTTAYTLATGDIGKVVGVGSGGSIEIPDATFAAGDAVLVFNNTTGDVTITCTITTAYIAGADADVASVTLSTRGVCNILFLSGTACVLTGNIA